MWEGSEGGSSPISVNQVVHAVGETKYTCGRGVRGQLPHLRKCSPVWPPSHHGKVKPIYKTTVGVIEVTSRPTYLCVCSDCYGMYHCLCVTAEKLIRGLIKQNGPPGEVPITPWMFGLAGQQHMRQ